MEHNIIAYWAPYNGFDMRKDCGMIKKNVKLTVTREEIRAALEKMYRRPVEDFTIIPSKPSATGLCIRNVVVRPEMKETKVSNIKRLRELSKTLRPAMTLLDGKWAIENWGKFIAFVDEFNRLPLSGYGSGDDKGNLK